MHVRISSLFILCAFSAIQGVMGQEKFKGSRDEHLDETVDLLFTAMDRFLERPSFAAMQVAVGFQTGSFTGGNETRAALFRKIRGMDASTDMIYVGLANGQFMGYYKESNGSNVYTFLPHENSSCIADGILELCRSEYRTDTAGNPITKISARGDFDPRTRPWYLRAQADGEGGYTHEPYTFATTRRIGISYAQPLYSSTGAFLGVVGFDYDLGELDTVFQELVGEHNSLVYGVEHHDDSDRLVAASIPGVCTALVDGNWTQVAPTEVSSPAIQSSWRLLLDVEQNEHLHDVEVLDDRLSLHAFEYVYEGFEVFMVMIKEASHISDHIERGSFKYSFIVSLAGIGFLLTLFLTIVVLRYRHTAIWRLAQPELLLVILLANALGYGFVLSNVGDHYRWSCELRNWLLCLNLVTLSLSLHAKLDRVRRLDSASAKLAAVHESATQAIRRIAPFFAIMVLWLVLWTVVEGPHPIAVLEGGDESRTISHRCSDDKALYFYIPAVLYNGALFGYGSIAAFQTRHMSHDIAESRSIMFIFHNLNICATIWFVVQYLPGTNVSRPDNLTLRSILFFWVHFGTQISIFGPRIYRHMAYGDYTAAEVTTKLKVGQNRHSMPNHMSVCSACAGTLDHGSVTIKPIVPETPTDTMRREVKEALVEPIAIASVK